MNEWERRARTWRRLNIMQGLTCEVLSSMESSPGLIVAAGLCLVVIIWLLRIIKLMKGGHRL